MPEELCKKVLENIPTAIVIVDKSFNVQFFNKSFKDTFNQAAKKDMTVGNALNCANLKNGEKCGEGMLCGGCILRKYIKEAVYNNKKVLKRVVEKKLKSGGETKTFRIKLSIFSLDNGLYCCLLDDVTEIIEIPDMFSNNKMSRDFKRAKVMQNNMLPQPSVLSPLADFTYYYWQDYLVGGDFFDLYKFDGYRYGGYIADVSGSGISGGMMTVFLHEKFPKDIFSPAETLVKFSQIYSSLKLEEDCYITMFCFAVDTRKKEMLVCNAGHIIPAMIKRKGSADTVYIRGKTVSNWYDSVSYSDKKINYESGDMLILMTDGICDMKNSEGKEYTFNRIRDIVAKSKVSMNEMLKKIEIDFIKFIDGKLLKGSDDMALLMVKL